VSGEGSATALEWSSPFSVALAGGHGIHRELPGLARLHLDRPLPFLCVYRSPVDREDAGTERLISAEAAWLKASGDPAVAGELSSFLHEVVEALSEHFGGFLLLEIWSRPEGAAETRADEERRARVPRPVREEATVRVFEEHGRAPLSTVKHLVEALRALRIGGVPAKVERVRAHHPVPPGLGPLLSDADRRKLGCAVIGLELPPVFRGEEGVYPLLLRDLHRELTHALRRGLAEFLRAHTTQPVVHFLSLGPRCIDELVVRVDRALARLDRSFDFLVQVTPVNARAARARFFDGGCERAPGLRYRPCPIEPDLMKRTLYDLPIERIDDPIVEQLFLEKREELNRKLTMLHDLGTKRFLHGSLALYGDVEDPLLDEARALLEALPPAPSAPHVTWVSAEEMAARARAQLEIYAREAPEMKARVELRDDVVGFTVSRGNLLVADDAVVPAKRVDALLAHEIGTHVVTYVNGREQPFRLFALGLVGYDELQEGLGVLGEHLTDGLTAARLRKLAGRVVGARAVAAGATFVETFRLLVDAHGFGQAEAFGITLRLHRGGGLVKDAIYLRGLLFVLHHLRSGAELEPLYIGKIAAAHRPILIELRHRGLLVPPRLVPLHLRGPEAQRKLARLREGATPSDLVAREE
jgi:uncharacterized protein (TIGR02421 family)